MSVVTKFKQRVETATGSLTGAAPQQGNGSTLQAHAVQSGSLSAYVSVLVTVSTLTFTGKWQVSSNGTTWVDCYAQNNAAQVVIATGTGSGVTHTRTVDAPAAVYGHRYARYVVYTGVDAAAGAASEEYTISYNYRPVTILLAS